MYAVTLSPLRFPPFPPPFPLKNREGASGKAGERGSNQARTSTHITSNIDGSETRTTKRRHLNLKARGSSEYVPTYQKQPGFFGKHRFAWYCARLAGRWLLRSNST